jgi:hypothetical protein
MNERQRGEGFDGFDEDDRRREDCSVGRSGESHGFTIRPKVFQDDRRPSFPLDRAIHI